LTLKGVGMATIPTDEECARGILDVFKHYDMRPDESLPLGRLRAVFLKRGRADDMVRGIQYVIDKGWLVRLPGNWFKLTEAGFAAV
jgi:hypothetical protein